MCVSQSNVARWTQFVKYDSSRLSWACILISYGIGWLRAKYCIRLWYGYWLDLFISTGYDVAGPVAIGLTHWKNPYVQGRPTLPSDLPLFLSKDASIPVYHQSFTRKADLATPLSCPASLSITPVPSYSSSSQETLSQDTTGNRAGFFRGVGLGISRVLACISLLTRLYHTSACVVLWFPTVSPCFLFNHLVGLEGRLCLEPCGWSVIPFAKMFPRNQLRIRSLRSKKRVFAV